MPANLRIAEPCQQEWNDMLPDNNGRYCLSCCKTVVDFTGWETDAIVSYLLSRKTESTCGRLSTHQLIADEKMDTQQLLQRVIDSKLRVFKKLAAAIIIIFALHASSCNAPQTMGKAIVTDQTTTGLIMGEIAAPDSVCIKNDSAVFMGDIVIIDSAAVNKTN